MGIRLEADNKPEPMVKHILTKPVFPGCIQLPGNGNPIIIMNDGQTTGGYPVWAVVERDNLRIAGQLKVGDRIKFLHV
jgi:allophanate hydrolase/urea carboxylase